MKYVGRPENQLCVEQLLSVSILFAPRDSYIFAKLLWVQFPVSCVSPQGAGLTLGTEEQPWLRLRDTATIPTSQLHPQITVLPSTAQQPLF